MELPQPKEIRTMFEQRIEGVMAGVDRMVSNGAGIAMNPEGVLREFLQTMARIYQGETPEAAEANWAADLKLISEARIVEPRPIIKRLNRADRGASGNNKS